jgi:hypothetical protein
MKKKIKPKKISFIGKIPAKRTKFKSSKSYKKKMEEPEQEEEQLMEEPEEIKALENQQGMVQIGFDEEKPIKPENKPSTAENQALGSPAKQDLGKVDIKIPSLEAQSERKLEEEVRMLRIKKLEAEKRKLEAELQENNNLSRQDEGKENTETEATSLSEKEVLTPSVSASPENPEKKKYPPLPILSESLIPEMKPMPMPIFHAPENPENHVPENSKNVMIPTISEVFNPAGEHEIFLTSPDDMIIKICPLCKSKVKRTKIQQINNLLVQDFNCKNKKCNFKKRIVVKV